MTLNWIFSKVLPVLFVAGVLGLLALYVDVRQYVAGTSMYRGQTANLREELREHLKDNRRTVQDLVIRMTKVESQVDKVEEALDDLDDEVQRIDKNAVDALRREREYISK